MLLPYVWMLKIALALSFVAGLVYAGHRVLANERDMGYQKAVAEYTKKELLAEQAARAREAQMNKQLEEAQNAAIIRDQQITVLSNTLSANSDSLRNTVGSLRRGLPAASLDAIRKTADSALAVFSDCQSKYSEMAITADKHASDVKTLEEAWPK